MRSIDARFLTPQVNQWLGTSRQPRVLHVFDRACNLINEQRDVLSVVTPQIGNGPFNLVVADGILFRSDLDAGSSVSVTGSGLLLGDLDISIINARLWDPRPDWESLHTRKQSIFRLLSYLQIKNDLEGREFDLHHSALSIPQSLVSKLSTTLANADITSARQNAAHLAGVGIGLTPSGDDFLMGAIYAAWIIHPVEVAGMLAHEIASIAAPLTTSLSAAWLRSAGRGEAAALWHEFFRGLLLGDPHEIRAREAKILDVGETSGEDALAGFCRTMMAWVETS